MINSRILVGRDYKIETAKELEIKPGLDKIRHCTRNCIRRVNKNHRNRFVSVMKSYAPKSRKSQERPEKRLLGVVRSELVNRWPNDDDGEC